VLEFVKTNAISIVGLDSINGLMPRANAAKELDDNLKKAAHASMMSQFWQKYIPVTTGLHGVNQTTLLMTQQLRANQERANAPSHLQQYLPEAVVTGARSTRHYKLIDITLKEGKILKKGDAETGREAIGKVIRYDFEKGKAGTHDNIQGEYTYHYDRHGIDSAGDLITAGVRRGIIKKVGSRVVICQFDTGKVLEGMTAPSEKAMRGMIEADFEYELALRNEIMAYHGIQCLCR
jgi:RecA/RadA recombinase